MTQPSRWIHRNYHSRLHRAQLDMDGISKACLPILRNLRAGDGSLASIPEERRAILFQEKSYVHSYPHC